MKVYETMALSRSGHHSIKNWIIKNLIGFQIGWDYKMTVANGTNFYHLGEANHDIPLSNHFLKEFKEKIGTIMINYEDAPWDYTILNDNNIFEGPLSLDKKDEYNIEHMGRVCFIRDFYDLLSSRIKSNEKAIFLKWNEEKPHLFKVDQIYIERWKSHAMACVENKISYLKFEDWLNNKSVRDKFIFENFGVRDIHGTNGIIGTKSSFSTNKNTEERHQSLSLSDEMKDIIFSDKDLDYLLTELNYKKLKL